MAVTATEADGRREMLCLSLDYLNAWLFGVSAARVKPTIRACSASQPRMRRRLSLPQGVGRGVKNQDSPQGGLNREITYQLIYLN